MTQPTKQDLMNDAASLAAYARDIRNDFDKAVSLIYNALALRAALALSTLSAERDALREALWECADDLEAMLKERYGDQVTGYPDLFRKYDSDMAPIRRARALLSPERDASGEGG